MHKKLLNKVMLVTILLFVCLILGTSTNVFARGEGGGGLTLSGPPLVGTLTLDMVSSVCEDTDAFGNCTLYTVSVSANFSGCCADCFEACKNSCNIRAKGVPLTLHLSSPDLSTLTKDIMEGTIMKNQAPKGCYSQTGGETIILQDVITFRLTDIDNDGQMELVAKVIFLYLI